MFGMKNLSIKTIKNMVYFFIVFSLFLVFCSTCSGSIIENMSSIGLEGNKRSGGDDDLDMGDDDLDMGDDLGTADDLGTTNKSMGTRLMGTNTTDKPPVLLGNVEAPVQTSLQSPIEQAPIEQAPIEQAPMEQAPIEQAPMEQAPMEQAPIDQAPIEQTPIEQAPMEQAQTVQAPIKQASVVPVPIEKAPTEQANEASLDMTGSKASKTATASVNNDTIISRDIVKFDALPENPKPLSELTSSSSGGHDHNYVHDHRDYDYIISLNKKSNQHEGSLIKQATDIDNINTSMGSLENKMNTNMGDLETRMNTSMGGLTNNMNKSMGDLTNKMNTNMDGLTDKMNTSMDGIRDKMNAKFSEVEKQKVEKSAFDEFKSYIESQYKSLLGTVNKSVKDNKRMNDATSKEIDNMRRSPPGLDGVTKDIDNLKQFKLNVEKHPNMRSGLHRHAHAVSVYPSPGVPAGRGATSGPIIQGR